MLLALALSLRIPAAAADDPLGEATTLNHQAVELYNQGRYPEAEALEKRALAMREGVLGPDHADVANSLHNLVVTYWMQGRFSEAEPLCKRAVAILEKAAGPYSPDLAAELDELGTIYAAQGRFSDAEPLVRRSLEIREKALAPGSVETAKSMMLFGVIASGQGKFSDAEQLYERALEIQEQSLQPDNLAIRNILVNLAAVYEVQGRRAEAEQLLARIASKEVWDEHPQTTEGKAALAAHYARQKRYSDAERLYEEVVASEKKELGPWHFLVASSLLGEANAYREEGRCVEAEPLYVEAAAISEKSGGLMDRVAVGIINLLARCYQAQGKMDQALIEINRSTSLITRQLQLSGGQWRENQVGQKRLNRAGFMENIGIAYDAARAMPDREDSIAADTFVIAQLAQASSTAQAVESMSARFGAGSDELAAVVRERQDLVNRWHAIDANFIKMATTPAAEAGPAAEESLRAQLAETTSS
jgi:tetratricopeptide (TPR) repeat protein